MSVCWFTAFCVVYVTQRDVVTLLVKRQVLSLLIVVFGGRDA